MSTDRNPIHFFINGWIVLTALLGFGVGICFYSWILINQFFLHSTTNSAFEMPFDIIHAMVMCLLLVSAGFICGVMGHGLWFLLFGRK
jgi:hypothetical protein